MRSNGLIGVMSSRSGHTHPPPSGRWIRPTAAAAGPLSSIRIGSSLPDGDQPGGRLGPRLRFAPDPCAGGNRHLPPRHGTGIAPQLRGRDTGRRGTGRRGRYGCDKPTDRRSGDSRGTHRDTASGQLAAHGVGREAVGVGEDKAPVVLAGEFADERFVGLLPAA